MQVVTKSIYSTQLSACLLFGTEYNVLPETTLNEKFDITDVDYDDTAIPRLTCITIGRVPTVTDASIDADEYRPSPLNATLFDHIPFLVRPLDTDLTFSEQSEYKLRKEIEIDGSPYVAYYGLYMNPESSESSTIVIEDDEGALTPKILKPIDHSPLIPTYDTDPKLFSNNVKYLVVSEKVFVSLTPYVLREIYDACKLIHPGEDVVIGELGICSGILGNRSINIGNAVFDYKELANTQLNFTVKKNISLIVGGNTGINVNDPVFKTVTETIELGGMENVIFKSPVREII